MGSLSKSPVTRVARWGSKFCSLTVPILWAFYNASIHGQQRMAGLVLCRGYQSRPKLVNHSLVHTRKIWSAHIGVNTYLSYNSEICVFPRRKIPFPVTIPSTSACQTVSDVLSGTVYDETAAVTAHGTIIFGLPLRRDSDHSIRSSCRCCW